MFEYKGRFILEVKDLYIGMVVESYGEEAIIRAFKPYHSQNGGIWIDFSAGWSNCFWPTMYENTSPDSYRNLYFIPGKTILKDNNIVFSNKGRETCMVCACRTEKRRDFSDMSIREMCPRCKF